MKIILVAAELGAYALVSKDRGTFAVLLLQPLAISELAREGHADALSMFGLALGAAAFANARPRLGYGGFALAALAKLNGIVALFPAVRSTRRGLGVALLLVAMIPVPYLIAGASERAGLFAYAGAWRAGDGVFSLILSLAELILGGDYARLLGFTITRHQLARALIAAIFCASAVFLLKSRPKLEEVPDRVATLLLVLLLLSPTLHPWYTLWLLPLLVFAETDHKAIAVLLVLAPLLHHGSYVELVEGSWREHGWIRALVHVPVWLVFGYARAACLSKKEFSSASKTASSR